MVTLVEEVYGGYLIYVRHGIVVAASVIVSWPEYWTWYHSGGDVVPQKKHTWNYIRYGGVSILYDVTRRRSKQSRFLRNHWREDNGQIQSWCHYCWCVWNTSPIKLCCTTIMYGNFVCFMCNFCVHKFNEETITSHQNFTIDWNLYIILICSNIIVWIKYIELLWIEINSCLYYWKESVYGLLVTYGQR